MTDDAEVAEAVERASKEGGPVVGRVFCAISPDGRLGSLAFVSDTSLGLYYEARIPSGVVISATFERWSYERAHRFGKRLPYVSQGLCRYLLEWPPDRQDYPRAECPKHGVAELDPEAVVEAVRRRPRKAPARILIHQPS